MGWSATTQVCVTGTVSDSRPVGARGQGSQLGLERPRDGLKWDLSDLEEHQPHAAALGLCKALFQTFYILMHLTSEQSGVSLSLGLPRCQQWTVPPVSSLPCSLLPFPGRDQELSPLSIVGALIPQF